MNTLSKKVGQEISNLTLDEIQSLKLAAGDDEKWNTIVDQIKRDRGGEFPPDWYKEVIVGRIIEGTITIHSADTQESFGIDCSETLTTNPGRPMGSKSGGGRFDSARWATLTGAGPHKKRLANLF